MTKQQKMTSLGFTAEHFQQGLHMCYIYNDEDERREVMAKYIESGISEKEYVFYLVDTMTPEEMRSRLSEMNIHIPSTVDDRQFAILQAKNTYCPNNTFIPDIMLKTLADVYDHSLEAGFNGCRGMGEMTWALRGIPGSERLIEYESRINLVVKDHPLTAICQYNANLFDGATIFKILNVHPAMVVRGQVVKNPYYIPPEVFLKKEPGMKSS